MPKPLQNLFHDLRERKMLPLIALLVAAIIAVPLLLKEDAAEPPPAADVASADIAAGIEGAEIVNPVVLTDTPGIRDFHERLKSLQERNPFKQQLTGVPGAKGGDAGGSGSGGDGASAAPVTSSIDGSGGTASTSVEPVPATDTTTTEPETDETDKSKKPKTKTKNFVYYWEIDAKVGLIGKGKKKKGIKQLSYLPGDSHPVVQFIRGVDESAAIFVVSRSVVDARGDGNCKPRAKDCQFLLLKPGESTTFKYEPNGLNYRIKLAKVHLLRTRIDRKDTSASSQRDALAALIG